MYNSFNTLQFMDVCCSPGGFSEYVLESNQCRGVGLSLPLELGGHVPAIDTERFATPDRCGRSGEGVDGKEGAPES